MAVVDCVIVTYKADIVMLTNCVNSIISQVRKCYIVNNGKSEFYFDNDKVKIINLNFNKGISYAQNIGIKLSLEEKSDFIVLSDQDTVYPVNYIGLMEKKFKELESTYKIAALTPFFYDNIKKQYQTLMSDKFKYFEPSLSSSNKNYIVEHAIASGMFIPRNSFYSIGLMNEEMFIDYVDTEWCWRAKFNGFVVITTTDIIIKHNLGDEPVIFFNKKYTLRSSIRYYYIVRNTIYLIKGGILLTLKEKILFSFRLLKMILGIFILSPNRITNLQMVTSAIIDGLTKKMGEKK